MGLGHDHTHDEVIPIKRKPTSIWKQGNLDQTVLDTSDLEAIYDYLSDLKAPYGFIPSYFNYLSEDQLLDSSNFPVFDDRNYLPGLNPNHMGFIPANQVYAPNPYISEDLTKEEAIQYLMDIWDGEMVGQEPSYYDEMQAAEDFVNPSYENYDTRSWITRPKYEEDIPMMDYLAKITDSPELALGKGFFPIRNYPQIALDYLREYIDSGAEVGEVADYDGDPAGLFRTGYDDNPLGTIQLDPYYTKDMATKANILGHEGLHGAVHRYPFLLETSPYPYAGETKQPFNMQMANKYDPGKNYMYNRHFSSKAAFHPAIHGIDETFFGGHGQPSSMLDRVNDINPQNIANANFLMNYNAQKDYGIGTSFGLDMDAITSSYQPPQPSVGITSLPKPNPHL
tara:strand:+ start:536 stop:1723 length:1188 start_codon:yes stop_codon:yes gene_type:complete